MQINTLCEYVITIVVFIMHVKEMCVDDKEITCRYQRRPGTTGENSLGMIGEMHQHGVNLYSSRYWRSIFILELPSITGYDITKLEGRQFTFLALVELKVGCRCGVNEFKIYLGNGSFPPIHAASMFLLVSFIVISLLFKSILFMDVPDWHNIRVHW